MVDEIEGETLEELEGNIGEAYTLMMGEEALPGRTDVMSKEVSLDV